MSPWWLWMVSLSLTSGRVGSAIPRFCVLEYKVLICTSLNLKFWDVYETLAYDRTIKFMYIKTYDTSCTCDMFLLMERLRVVYVTVITRSTCQLEQMRACKVDPWVSNPQLVAGLVVSRDDPRRKWAIKNHVDNLWSKIKVMQHEGLKSSFYQSFVKDTLEGNRVLKRRSAEEAKRIRRRVPYTTLKLTKLPTTTVTTTNTTTTTIPKPIQSNGSYYGSRVGLRRHIKYGFYGRRRGSRGHRGKSDNALINTRIVKYARLMKRRDITDTKFIQATFGRFPVSSNHSPPVITEMPYRRKRQASVESVVPYLVFAGGRYINLYNTEAIRRALITTTQPPPTTQRTTTPKRTFPTPKPVTRAVTRAVTRPFVIPTQPTEKFLSPAEIRRMTRESDHRMKSFIIFFVAITGIITVIALLLIMAMRSTGDSRRKPRHFHANCRCCDQRRMEQECLLNDYEDTMHGRCPLFHYYQGAQQCPPNTCSMPQIMKQVTPAGPNEKATQTDGRCHPTLGGRHVVTEFEAWCQDHTATYKPPGLNWSVGCAGQFVRDGDTTAAGQGGPALLNMAMLPCMNGANRNVNRPIGNVNNSSPLVSFLDSIVKEKDGIMREYHRDQFNVKGHRRRQRYQPVLHPHAPGSRPPSVPSVKKRQKSIVRTNSSGDTTEPEPRKTSSVE